MEIANALGIQAHDLMERGTRLHGLPDRAEMRMQLQSADPSWLRAGSPRKPDDGLRELRIPWSPIRTGPGDAPRRGEALGRESVTFSVASPEQVAVLDFEGTPVDPPSLLGVYWRKGDEEMFIQFIGRRTHASPLWGPVLAFAPGTIEP